MRYVEKCKVQSELEVTYDFFQLILHGGYRLLMGLLIYSLWFHVEWWEEHIIGLQIY